MIHTTIETMYFTNLKYSTTKKRNTNHNTQRQTSQQSHSANPTNFPKAYIKQKPWLNFSKRIPATATSSKLDRRIRECNSTGNPDDWKMQDAPTKRIPLPFPAAGLPHPTADTSVLEPGLLVGVNVVVDAVMAISTANSFRMPDNPEISTPERILRSVFRKECPYWNRFGAANAYFRLTMQPHCIDFSVGIMFWLYN